MYTLLTCFASVTSAMQHDCFNSPTTTVHESSGYLSSVVANNENVGTAECPWRIEAEDGQRIAITLFDFGIFSRQRTELNVECDEYAIITEYSTGQQTSICGGDQRVIDVYTSRTYILDVSIIPVLDDISDREFILKYKGIAIFRIMEKRYIYH